MSIDHGPRPEHDDHDGGLAADLSAFLSRRRLFSLAAGAGAAATLAAYGPAVSSGTAPVTEPPSTSDTSATGCEAIPEETAGPYPGDGSNGPNALTEADIVRSDIRASIGEATGMAEGIPLTIELALTDTGASCAPLAGAAVYLWHCDRDGNYSLYSEGIEGENYLRGVQESDADGTVRFISIFPACYSGRWPHIHFEVYESVDAATGGGEPISTSQLALPEDVCDEVYTTSGYEQSVVNLSEVTLATDNVFGEDQAANQLATVTATGDTAAGDATVASDTGTATTGDTTAGYLATLAVAV